MTTKEKAGDVVIHQLGRSIDVIFYETSSWWSNEKVAPPDSLELQDEVQNHLNGGKSR